MISKSLCDSVGGGGLVAEFFRDLRKPMRFSGAGGGVVAEIFRDLLRKPIRFSGGGGGGVVPHIFYKDFLTFPKGGPGRPLNRPL